MSRKVRIAAFTDLNDKRPRTIADNLDWTSAMLDNVAAEKPDIVCLTENFDSLDTGLGHLAVAQTPEGPVFTRIAEKAKQHGCYIICATIEKRGDKLFNTAAVIDRQGNVVGRYDKIHPTIPEIEDQVTPGAVQPSVFQTDFGKIGCQICFDSNWPNDWQDLKNAGAEIVFFSSAFSGGRILQSLATIFHIPVVAACYRQCCRIVDRDGLILDRQGVYKKWVLAELDLDNPLFHLDYQFDKLEAVRKTHGPDVEIRTYEEEGWWRIVPRKPGLDILDIIKAFELETLEAYLARSTKVQDAARIKSTS